MQELYQQQYISARKEIYGCMRARMDVGMRASMHAGM